MAIIKEEEQKEEAYNPNPELSAIDQELEEILKKQTAKVKVFGVGGGGGNTLSRMLSVEETVKRVYKIK